MISVNIWGVLLAALSCFIIGFMFHGPLFGKLWMKLANIHPTGNEKFSDMYGQLVWNFISNIVAALVLSHLVKIMSLAHIMNGRIAIGVVASLMLWAAVTANSAMEPIWMGRKVPHWLFEAGTSLVCFIVMGIIVAVI